MKKVCRNIFAAIAAVALVSSFASCSDGSSDDEVENPKPEDGTSVVGEEITFVAVADSTNSEDTVLFVKYDRSAKGADELIKISNAELKISVNGNVTKTYNSITFALDEYGASFSGKTGLLTDKADMKEYKTKLPVGAQVKKGDTVKVVLTKGSVSGAGKDKVDLTGVVVALIDKAEKVSYYKELAENEYLPLIKVEDKKIEDKKPEEKKEEVKPEEEKKSEAEKKPEESQEQKPAEKTDEQKPAEGSEGQNTQPAEGNSENGAGGESQTEDYGLLTTAVDLTWDVGATVEAEKIASATDNKKFVVTYISNNDTDYHTFKMRVVNPEQELYEGVEKNISINRTATDPNDLHGCSFSVAPNETPATFTYKPSAAEWVKLKTGGFNIYGHGAKITKIVLEDATESDVPAEQSAETPAENENVVWTGSKVLGWGNDDGIVLSGTTFAGKNFTGLKVNCTATQGGFKIATCTPWSEIAFDNIDGCGSDGEKKAIYPSTEGECVVTLTIPAADIANMKTGGIKIMGDTTITITKVELVTE